MASFEKTIVIALTAALSGCALEGWEAGDLAGGGEPLGEAEGATVGDNALSFNALNLNALNLNALNLNALNLNALSAESLAAIQDPGANGALARDFVRYAASCALGSGQSFVFSWSDALGVVHDESYPGLLGLAPGWADGPLDEAGQLMVSACLASRVNYYQIPVVISARSHQEPLKSSLTTQELAEYPNVEGAFWGNLFDAKPYLNTCYNAATVVNSRAWHRDCAAGHLKDGGGTKECGMIRIAGSCSDVCGTLSTSGKYYSSCVEHPGKGGSTIKEVITTALP